jgi:type II secretory pathway component PulF
MDWFLYSWPTLILLGLGLRMALRLTYGARGPEPGDPIFVFLSTNSWVLIGLGLAPAVIAGAVTFVGGLIALLAASALVEVVIERRAAQRRSTATMLALMVDRGHALDSSVLFTGQPMRGIAGRAADRLFRALDEGTPLVDAIAAHPRALPPEALAYLAAGQTRQAEAAALRELSRSEHSELASIWRACIDRTSYLVFVLAMMVAVLAFIMIKLVPEFEKIFAEFSVDMPKITQLAVSVSQLFTQYFGAPIVMALVLLVFGSFIVAFCYLADLAVLRPWGEALFRGRATAHVLRILAVTTEQRQSLSHALTWLAHVYPSAALRSRLTAAANQVNSGAGRDALVDARIVTAAEHGLLQAAARAGNLPWALRQIARRRERRAVYRWATVLQIAYPAAILLLGAFVAFYVIALFVPIVQLIYGLAS